MGRDMCRHILLATTTALALTLGGCGWNSQFSKIQSEKEQLVARVDQEIRRSEELSQKVKRLSKRASEAERQLAMQYERYSGERLSEDRPTRTRNDLPPEDGESLVSKDSVTSSSLDQWSLQDFARRNTSVRLNRKTGKARVQADLRFTEGDRLKPDSKRSLSTIAKELASPDADGLRIWIFGYSETSHQDTANARAKAVADVFRQQGVSHERVRVKTLRRPSPTDEDGTPFDPKDGVAIAIELEERPVGARVDVDTLARPLPSDRDRNERADRSDDGWTSSDKRLR